MSPSPPAPTPEPVHHDSKWFGREVLPHASKLRSFLRRRYPSLNEIDDVVQDSLLKAVLADRKGKLVSIKGFLFTVAINSALSLLRRKKFISSESVNEMPALRVLDDNADVVETVCAEEELAVIAEAIAGLPARCRRIVTLRFIHGLDYVAIAQQLGLSVSTVRVQVARGMAKCSEFLRERGIVDGAKR